MPLYNWTDKKTEKKVEILRSFSEYLDPPDKEEAEKAGLTAEEFAAAEWSKKLGLGVQMVRGPNWGAGKGNW